MPSKPATKPNATRAPRAPRSKHGTGRGQRLAIDERETAQQRFLAAFREYGIVRTAAEAAGVGRRTIYDWRESDSAFAAAYDEALDDANDAIRREIHRRGVEGWDEVTSVIVEGDQGARTETRTVHRRSDAMLRMLAQARMPEYRERVDITSQDKALDYARIIASPELAELAARLAETAGLNPGRAGETGE